MQTVTVGRRRYSDPDVISLISATGQLIDPRFTVVSQARQLNLEYDDGKGDFSDPIKRLAILASLRGFRVEEMDRDQARSEPRDAVVIPTDHGSRGVILFNPTRPRSRVGFSIAHEIVHTFFPNSMSGARFRSVCAPGSKQARELESLCDLGASELLMPSDEFRRVTGGQMGLGLVERARGTFGSSYEATVFRLATTYPGFAAAGLLQFRRRIGEEKVLVRVRAQRNLFGGDSRKAEKVPPKYRRQSLFTSDLCDADDFIVRWNKSFDPESCVYVAGKERRYASDTEALPNDSPVAGTMEAIPAPYQREDADPDWPDVLFLWWR
jgi:hypothetical protein